jgi:hypothetical protein
MRSGTWHESCKGSVLSTESVVYRGIVTMIRFLLVASTLIGSVEMANGQTAGRTPALSRPALVRAWHRQYFHREPDARAVASWSYLFRLGRTEQEVLAVMLSTDEYYNRAGRTSEGLVRALFEDGAQTQLTSERRQALLSRSRDLDRRNLAATFLQTYPEALRAGPSHVGVMVAGLPKPVKAEAERSPPRSRPMAAAAATPRRPRALRR